MQTILEKLNHFFSDSWQIAVLDMIKGRWILKPEPLCIPYLKAENANGRHILIRSNPEIEPHYLLADDLTWPLISKQHKYPNGKWKPGRMVVETSPANYQVWIRSMRSLALEEKRFWLKKLCSDPAADPNHRWGRCPGFRNRKEKYRDAHGGYPLSKLIWIDWKQKAHIPLVGEDTDSFDISTLSPQPQGGVCLQRIVARTDFESSDESSTDFTYALALARRDYSDEYIKERIVAERTNWKNHPGAKRMNQYLDRTITKARAIVQKS